MLRVKKRFLNRPLNSSVPQRAYAMAVNDPPDTEEIMSTSSSRLRGPAVSAEPAILVSRRPRSTP